MQLSSLTCESRHIHRLPNHRRSRNGVSSVLRAVLVLLWPLWMGPVSADARASSEIEVLLTDGQRLRVDQIGPETSAKQLALRLESDRIVITRLIAWQKVHSVRIGGKIYTGRGFQASFTNIRFVKTETEPVKTKFKIVKTDLRHRPPARKPCDFTPAILPIDSTVIGVRDDPLAAYRDALERYFPHGVPVSETPYVLGLLRARMEFEMFNNGPRTSPAPPKPMPRQKKTVSVIRPHAPIQSLRIRAVPISASGKVDWDALAVAVSAVDRHGNPTPVHGTLRVTLWGQKQRLVRSHGEQFFGQPGRVAKIASWTRRLDPSALPAGQRQSTLNLPLPRPLPDHDLSWAPFGELHVQLLAPGAGVFETTERNILLRHQSPLRDRQLIETGSRFFPNEATHDSRILGGLLFRDQSSLGPNGRVLSVQP